MPDVPQTTDSNSFPALSFDADEFIQYVKDQDLTDGEAYEFLATVWIYMVTFVDLNLGIHPIQQTQPAQQKKEGGNKPALDHESALVLTCKETFNDRTNDKIVQRQKRRGAGKKDS